MTGYDAGRQSTRCKHRRRLSSASPSARPDRSAPSPRNELFPRKCAVTHSRQTGKRTRPTRNDWHDVYQYRNYRSACYFILFSLFTSKMQGKFNGFMSKARETATAAGGQASSMWKVRLCDMQSQVDARMARLVPLRVPRGSCKVSRCPARALKRPRSSSLSSVCMLRLSSSYSRPNASADGPKLHPKSCPAESQR